MEKVLFTEEQRHRQWWLWVILIVSLLAVLIPFLYGIYVQEVLGNPFGDNPMSTEGLIVTGSFSVLIMFFIIFVVLKTRLITKITTQGLFLKYPPIYRKMKKIDPDEIEKYTIRNFRVVKEFGGYGKKKWKYGKAYIISGNTGLQITFKDGKKIMIGTQKKQAIKYAMDKMMEQNS